MWTRKTVTEVTIEGHESPMGNERKSLIIARLGTSVWAGLVPGAVIPHSDFLREPRIRPHTI